MLVNLKIIINLKNMYKKKLNFKTQIFIYLYKK